VNIGSLLTQSAQTYGALPAIRYDEERLSYKELNEAAARFGSGLLAGGLSGGDRVALFMGNSHYAVIALFGCLKAGLVVVPINAKLAGNELAYIIENAEAAALVFSQEKSDEVGQALREASSCWAIRVGDGEIGTSFEEVTDAGMPEAGDAQAKPDQLAWLFYTSGTTGRPKGAQLSHRNLLIMTIGAIAEMCDFRCDDIVLHAAPLSHGSGLYLFAAVASGSQQLIYHRHSFDPDDVLALIARERVTVIAFLAPTMISMLLSGDPSDTTSLRRVVYGGGPINLELSRNMLARFGPIFVQLYGMGEAPMTISRLAAEDHNPADSAALASAGTPRLGVEVRIIGGDGQVVGVGEEGEICVRGDVVMSGYWRDPEATAKALADGWLHTGDIGQIDSTGRLSLLDRRSDLIITGGTNVYPREVEETLLSHPAVAEVVVFGLPDPVWGQSVAAAVVTVPDAVVEAEELITFCRERAASFKKPKQIYFVDEIPKNAYGKVLRREVRDRAVKDQA